MECCCDQLQMQFFELLDKYDLTLDFIKAINRSNFYNPDNRKTDSEKLFMIFEQARELLKDIGEL